MNPNDRNHEALKTHIDASHLQPKDDRPAPTIWQDRSTEIDVVAEIDNVIKELGKDRIEFEEFQKTNPYIAEKRRQWVIEGNRDDGNVLKSGLDQHSRFVSDYKSREPGLAETPAIAEARKRVADLKSKLQEAEQALLVVESSGSPLTRYVKKLTHAEACVISLKTTLQKQKKAHAMLEIFGHADDWRLDDAARMHLSFQPSVARIGSLVFRGRLIGGSEALTIPQLQAAHKMVLDTLLNLRELAV